MSIEYYNFKSYYTVLSYTNPDNCYSNNFYSQKSTTLMKKGDNRKDSSGYTEPKNYHVILIISHEDSGCYYWTKWEELKLFIEFGKSMAEK